LASLFRKAAKNMQDMTSHSRILQSHGKNVPLQHLAAASWDDLSYKDIYDVDDFPVFSPVSRMIPALPSSSCTPVKMKRSCVQRHPFLRHGHLVTLYPSFIHAITSIPF
jgi:hypothetical protein